MTLKEQLKAMTTWHKHHITIEDNKVLAWDETGADTVKVCESIEEAISIMDDYSEWLKTQYQRGA